MISPRRQTTAPIRTEHLKNRREFGEQNIEDNLKNSHARSRSGLHAITDAKNS
jgi:hypothetical protein